MNIKELMINTAEMYGCYRCGNKIESCEDPYCEECYIIMAKEYKEDK